MRKALMTGIAAALAIGILFTGCPTESGDDDKGPPSFAYAGVDSSGTTYVLVITEGTGRAVYTAKTGDGYVLTITYQDGSTKISRGTVGSVSGNDLSLNPEGAGTSFTVTVAGTGISGITGSIAVEGGGTPVSPPSDITPTDPNNPTKPVNPVITNADVYISIYSGTPIPYTGSGTIAGFGKIEDGKLSLAYPGTVPDSGLTTLSADAYKSPGAAIIEDKLTFSASDVKGTMGDFLEFTEEEGDFPGSPYLLSFLKRDTGNKRVSIFYLYVNKPLSITGWLKTEKITQIAGMTRTSTSVDEWKSVTLKTGWNKLQCDYDSSETNHPSGDSESIRSNIFRNASADTPSGFQWVLENDFEVTTHAYTFNSGTSTVTLKDFRWVGSGDSQWEQASAVTFPANGKWYKVGDNSVWIEFDTAKRTMEFHDGFSDRTGVYHIAGNTLRWAW
jgi:hypothetical protein